MKTPWILTRSGMAYPWLALGVLAVIQAAGNFASGKTVAGVICFVGALIDWAFAAQVWSFHTLVDKATRGE